ncbi:MAG: hypothetical protein ACYCO9_04495 [Streptosporangiaceae bacterium]
MSETSSGSHRAGRDGPPWGAPGQGAQARRAAADYWERRATELAGEVQRWLIRTGARTMRDELGGQVRKAFGAREADPGGDVWSTATTEPPGAAGEPPECAWCPVCRAARKIAQARVAAGPSSAGPSSAGPRLADAADVMAAAVRDALSGLESILSYRPADGGTRPSGPGWSGPDQPGRPGQSEEGADEPDDRG